MVITLNSNATPTAVTALVRNITYQNTDTDAPTTGARTVRYVLTDGDGGTSPNYDTTVTVSAVNDAPVLADTALSLTVAEDAGAPSGAVGSLVSAFTGGITDVDSGASKGIAITGSNQTNGIWYYTTNGGTTWTAVGTVSNTSALLLADNATTRLYVAPNANYNGTSTAALTLRAWDQTSGTAGTKVSTASNGGTTAFSSATDTVDVTVSGVNDAPTDLVLSANTVAENAANGTVVGTASTTDPDAGDTHTYQLTDTAGGRFAINSATGEITVADGSLLNYESASSHSITVRTTDVGGLTHDQTFTITLTDVNENPATFTGGSISLQQKAIQTEDRRLQSEGLRPPNVETVESKNVAYPAYSQDEVVNGIPQDGTRSDVSKEPPSFSPAQIVAVTRFLDEMASSEGPSPIHEMLDRHFDEVKQLLQTAENEALPDPGILRNQPDHLQTVLSAWLIANGVNLVPTRKPLVRARQVEGEKPASLENDERQSFIRGGLPDD